MGGHSVVGPLSRGYGILLFVLTRILCFNNENLMPSSKIIIARILISRFKFGGSHHTYCMRVGILADFNLAVVL